MSLIAESKAKRLEYQAETNLTREKKEFLLAKEKQNLSKFWWHFLYLSFIFIFIVAWGVIQYHNYKNMEFKIRKMERTFDLKVREMKCNGCQEARKEYVTR